MTVTVHHYCHRTHFVKFMDKKKHFLRMEIYITAYVTSDSIIIFIISIGQIIGYIVRQ